MFTLFLNITRAETLILYTFYNSVDFSEERKSMYRNKLFNIETKRF